MRIEGSCAAPLPEFVEAFVVETGNTTGFYDGRNCQTFQSIKA